MELMFDLETLDTTPDAVVLSVGAVVFHQGGDACIIDRLYRVLDIQAQIDAGRTISQSTLLWWMEQSEVARDAAFIDDRAPPALVSLALNHFSEKYGISRFWAGPSTFDFPIWDSLAQDCHFRAPWTYRQTRDLRTIVDESGISIDAEDEKWSGSDEVPHHPVYDCERQINLLAAARNALRR